MYLIIHAAIKLKNSPIEEVSYFNPYGIYFGFKEKSIEMRKSFFYVYVFFGSL